MSRQNAGIYECHVPDVHVGTRYRYRIDGHGPFPDPASRFQPLGVHGPSEVVDPASFAWTDTLWSGPTSDTNVIYELHVGTFTKSGTFAAATDQLTHLANLGITLVELMPLADFPGQHGWGYDGVCLSAPARCYGSPDDLRAFVNKAHELNIAVLIDVVYNHLGPDGNYLSQFSSYYFSKTHQTDWGTGLNFDGPQCDMVRQFFIDSAEQWVRDYHFDGVRLDATHAIIDTSTPHFLKQLSDRLHEVGHELGRRVLVIAEDERNLNTILQPHAQGGYGLDGVWADDLHHQIRRAFTGQSDGYFADYTGTAEDMAATLNHGWFYCGQKSIHKGSARGTKTDGLHPRQFVVCIQNHDQIGNRAFGERLNHQIDRSAYRAASALLMLAPQTPLLFMGQEWAATSPFLYFTDHNPELGKLVTEGRRREFRHFELFANPQVRECIPDPQAKETFQRSQLNWDDLARDPHAGTLLLYQDLIRLRRNDPCLASGGTSRSRAIGKGIVLLERTDASGTDVLGLLITWIPGSVAVLDSADWSVVLNTESDRYTTDPRPPLVKTEAEATVVHFPCPAAVILRRSIQHPQGQA